MARLHAGVWRGSFDCAVCRSKPGQLDVWGCDNRSILNENYWPLVQLDDNIFRLSSCPYRYVPQSVRRWIGEYVYHKNFTSAPMPEYAELNPAWIDAMNIYESEYSDALKEKK